MFDIGVKVRLKNQLEKIGIIRDIDARNLVTMYGIEFMEKIEYHPLSNLVLFSGQHSLKDNLQNGRFGKFYDFQKAMTFLKLSNSDSVQNNIYAFNTSKTIFYEYQFKPLLKLISSHKRRLLICDEVGLGKTIEAGLILKELQARKEVENVLIVVPANLISKWKYEMSTRFQENFNVIHKSFFKQITSGNAQALKQYSNNKFLISIESIRGNDIIKTIDESDYMWDLLIVDEAHSLRNLSKQNRTIQALSYNVHAMVLLTATPIHTSSANLFNILHILDEAQFSFKQSFEDQREANEPIVHALNAISTVPPNVLTALEKLTTVHEDYKKNLIYQDTVKMLQRLLSIDNIRDISIEDIVAVQRNLSDLHLIGGVYNRTKKRDVHTNRPIRVPKVVRVNLSDEEVNLYHYLVTQTRLHLEEDDNCTSFLPLTLVQRMLSSSIHAHKGSINKKYSLEDYDSEDIEDMILQESENVIWDTHPDFDDSDASKDSKLQKLIEELHIIQSKTDKVILFAFFICTLSYLKKHLEALNFNVLHLTSSLSMEERSECINSFRNSRGFTILLSSRVGSEGIDLQFCNTIINYDLPWNPMEIEQRIGRIDRIGQTSPTIDIINFSIEETIDDRIILRLYERINLFEGTIGALEPIMGELIEDLNKEILYKNLTIEEADQKWFEQEKIIMHKILDAQEIESASTDLMSLDYYYEHEIKNIRKKKRYISPEHLQQYISGFLIQNYKDSYLKYNHSTNEGEVQLCDSFRNAVRGSKYEKDLCYTFAPNRKIRFTFSSDHATEHQDMVFINILHPLVRFITYKYSLDKSNILNCHFFLIRQSDLEENEIHLELGYYFYFVFLASITSFRKHSVIMSIVLDENLEVAGNSDMNEHIMGILNEMGKHSVQDLDVDEPDAMAMAYSIAFDTFKNRFFDYYNGYKARHEMLIERKRQSRIFHFRRKIDGMLNELDVIENRGALSKDEQFRKNMLEAQIRTQSEALNKNLEIIDNEKECNLAYEEPVFGGVFEVV